MHLAPRSASAVAAVLWLASLGGAVLAQSAPVSSGQPAAEKRQTENAAPEGAPAEAPAEAEGDKRVCRHVKLDASSRRKTKVCRTVEEWRALNNIR